MRPHHVTKSESNNQAFDCDLDLQFLICAAHTQIHRQVRQAWGRMCINDLMKHLPQQISGKHQRLLLWEHAGDTDDGHHHADGRTDTDLDVDPCTFYVTLLPKLFSVDSTSNL